MKKNIIKKTIEKEIVPKTSDTMIMEKLSTDDTAYLVAFAQKLMSGVPLIFNFSDLDIDQGNKVLSFFSGIIFAIDGTIRELNSKTFMFLDSHAFDDGSVYIWLKDNGLIEER
jgi:cell division inhibitor SepF